MEGNDHTKTTPDLEDTNRARLETNEEKGQALLGRFIPQSNQNRKKKRKHVPTDLNRTVAQSGPDDELTEEEFNEALRRSGKDIEPGPDKIRYSDIKKLTEEDRTIYQESFDKGYIPEDWTDSTLRPISKRGKAHELNGYRILTMQNTVGKLMEGTVARKLARDLEDREILPENKGGGVQTRKMLMGKCSCICI